MEVERSTNNVMVSDRQLSKLALSRRLLILVFFLGPCLLPGQTRHISDFSEFALGYSVIHEQLPEGYPYTPFFAYAKFPVFRQLLEKNKKLKVYVEPQLVLNNPPLSFPINYEFGINAGLLIQQPLSIKNGFTLSLGAGPHFISLETEMQANGFIFSDNFELGFYQQFWENTGLSVKSRFRHISNAGLQDPNLGIDNLFVLIGFFWNSFR